MIATGSTQNAEALVRIVKGRSLGRDAWARLKKNRAAMAGIIALTLIALTAIFAPLLSAYRYDEINYDLVTCAPAWWPQGASCIAPGHIFGTDAVGSVAQRRQGHGVADTQPRQAVRQHQRPPYRHSRR